MSFLTECDYHISYKKGSSNKADPLSQHADFDNGSNDNENQIVLPESKFNLIETLSGSMINKESLKP